jgi:hypothetical protein
MLFLHNIGKKISRHKRRLLCCAAVLALLEPKLPTSISPSIFNPRTNLKYKPP